MLGVSLARKVRHKSCGATRSYPWEVHMAWSTPVVVEVCLGMEVTSYAAAQS